MFRRHGIPLATLLIVLTTVALATVFLGHDVLMAVQPTGAASKMAAHEASAAQAHHAGDPEPHPTNCGVTSDAVTQLANPGCGIPAMGALLPPSVLLPTFRVAPATRALVPGQPSGSQRAMLQVYRL